VRLQSSQRQIGRRKLATNLQRAILVRVREGSLRLKTRPSLSAFYREQSCPSPTRLGVYRPDCSFGETKC
jgi:hypothetical protein